MSARRIEGFKRMVNRLKEKCLPGHGQSSDTEVVTFGGQTMGTTYNVTVHGLPIDTAVEALRHATHSALDDVNKRMSVYSPDSELSRFNAHKSQAPFSVSAGTAEVFRISRQVSEQSCGAFDITVGPLVNAWGFGPEKTSSDPDGPVIAALRERVGWRLVEARDDNTLVKKHPDLHCDLSAVAKGYGVDKAAEALDRLGAKNYLVEVGGEVRTKGVNPDGHRWRLAIERPSNGGQHVQLVVGLSGFSLATSGDYRIFRIQDGKRLSHEIDPRTGRPVKNSVASASVIHPSCAWADAYATALMVLDPDDGYAFAEKNRLAVYLLERGLSGEFIARQTEAFGKYSSNG
jgi:thiamine biosynthesis lipoprotein